jgi:membrane protein DedA with SNARE-associated domain/membrane-associated phospholipid phosphatase
VIENLIEDLGSSLGQWAYLLVAFMALAETAAFVGFIAPGEFAVIFGGVLAGEGTLSIELLIGIVWASVVAGDTIGFLIGRRFGRGFAVRHGPKVRLTEERLQKVEGYFARHGGKTIFIGRWLGLVRPLMPFTAGASGMSYRRFLPYDVLGAGTWSATFCLLGFIFWRSFTQIADVAGKGSLGFGIALVLFVGVYQAVKRLRHPEQRARLGAWLERQGRRPILRPVAALVRVLRLGLFRPLWRFLLRPVWRVVAPPTRFLVRRLMPGELGIELTTLLAIATVAIYVLVLQIDLIGEDTMIAGDRWAHDLARDIEGGTLTALAKVVTALGAFVSVFAAVMAAGFYLLYRGRRFEAVTLAAAFATSEIAMQIMKAAVERPRPSGGLVDSSGWSYPSGHATLAVTYLVIGVVLARAGPAARRASFVVVGLLVAVLVGLSRAYLRVHYLSDVIGGWALGLSAVCVCGSVALVVHYLRHSLGGSGTVAPPQSESASG